jgi:RimJ/RimL family protein N-acetyltransferase
VTEQLLRFVGVPERIELEDGVVIRRYVEADIPHLVDVVNANLEHLGPWMPWAQAPVTVDAQLAWFRETDTQWDDGTNFVYGIFDAAGRIIGGTGFHIRNGPGALEIGYWVAADSTGRGVATRVSAALTEAAREVPGATRVEIHCDVANVRSSAVPRKLGYTLARVEPREPTAPGETDRTEVWTFDL